MSLSTITRDLLGVGPPPTPVTGLESAPLARSQTLTPWLCMGHGVVPGVSLWGTLGVATSAMGALGIVFRGVKSWEPGNLRLGYRGGMTGCGRSVVGRLAWVICTKRTSRSRPKLGIRYSLEVLTEHQDFPVWPQIVSACSRLPIINVGRHSKE